MVLASIALGSNLPDRAVHIIAGAMGLASLASTRLISLSTIHETQPVGPVAQGPYLNAAAVIETSLEPHELLKNLHAIESSRGRMRESEIRWGPRTLDLDLLTYGSLKLNSPELILPHPRLLERAFVLVPLTEIAPDLPIPNSTLIHHTPHSALSNLLQA